MSLFLHVLTVAWLSFRSSKGDPCLWCNLHKLPILVFSYWNLTKRATAFHCSINWLHPPPIPRVQPLICCFLRLCIHNVLSVVMTREYEVWQEMVKYVLLVAVNTKMNIRFHLISGTLKYPAMFWPCRWQKSQILLYI
jgi:hypothetical protein